MCAKNWALRGGKAARVGYESLVGSFVRVGLDLGKVVSVDDDEALIEFFDAPVPGGTSRQPVPVRGLSPVALEPQTRVWWKDSGQWRIGRVLEPPDSGSSTYLIALFEQRNVELSPDQFQVRWSRPLRDPVRLLEARTADAPFFQRARSAFIREVLRHRDAAQQLTGITSAGVRLHLHQVVAARRVLRDPVRRYLLADEVGLGKTIEAGMVMRQIMLETPGSRGLVLAPDPLVGQWEHEIADKFDLQGLNGGWVDVRRHEAALREHEDNGKVPVSILIIDEAHRLAEAGADENLYAAVARLAAETPALLLLSATPVRSNEEPFLRLLHLLDPQNYQLGDLDAFRHRVEQRDEIGNAVTLLSEDSPVFLLDEAAQSLSSAFPEDEDLAELLTIMRAEIAAGRNEQARVRAREVRHYVSDTYRIHRRLIRNRRNERLHSEFPVRQREHNRPFRVRDPDPRRAAVVEALDRFRGRLSEDSYENDREFLRLVAARCSAATPAVQALADALDGARTDDLLDWEQPVVDQLRSHRIGNELAGWLHDALTPDATDERLKTMATWAWSKVNKCKVAACTSYTSVATAAAQLMQEQYGDHRVAALLSTMSSSELELQLTRAETDPLCVLLICDWIGEEGWNLQFVSEVLHLDLPWSANRLEQRLGRFDRFAVGHGHLSPVRSSVVADAEPLNELTDPWTQLLDEGFDIFCRSSATLQYALPEREEVAVRRVISDGFGALSAAVDAERVEVTALRKSIEGQDILDAVEEGEEDRRFFDQLKKVDQSSKALGDAASTWIGKALNFSESYHDGVLRFGISKRNPPLLTSRQVRSLSLDAFHRRYAVRRKDAGVDGVVPLRPGQPLVDGAFDLCFSDGRGVAFARMLRHEARPSGSIFPVFFFDFLIEPSLTNRVGDRNSSFDSLRQLASAHLPARLEAVWHVPGRGEPPEEVRRLLTSSTMVNLGEDGEAFASLTAGIKWESACRQAEERAKEVVRGRTDVTDAISQALKSLDDERARVVARSKAMSRRQDTQFDEGAVADQFQEARIAISQPAVVTDSCGVVFLVGPE